MVSVSNASDNVKILIQEYIYFLKQSFWKKYEVNNVIFCILCPSCKTVYFLFHLDVNILQADHKYWIQGLFRDV